MSKRRGTQHRRRRSHEIDITTVPPGYVVFDDGDGREQLVHDPDLIEWMRSQCHICNGEGEH